MSKTTRRAGGTAGRFFLLLGALATVAILAAGMVRYSVADRGAASEGTALTATVTLLLLSLGTAAMSARRVRDDLNDYRRAHESAGAVAGSLVRGSALTGMAVRGISRGSADLVDNLAWVLCSGFALATVGWAVEVPAIPALAVWVGGPLLGLLAGYTVAARVAAWSGQRLRVRDARGAGALIPAALLGALLGVGMYLLGSTFGQPEWPTVLSAGVLGASVGALAVGTRAARASDRRREVVRGSVAAALSVPESALDSESDVRWSVGRDGAISIQPGPASVAKASADLDGLEARVAGVMPSHEVDRAASGPGFGVRLVPVTTETLESRRLALESEGLATAVTRIEDAEGEPVDRESWSLGSTVSPAHAGRVETVARQRGLSLLRWEPMDRRAIVGRISPTAADVRQRLAEVLKCDPWSLDVAVLGTADREVDRVTVSRGPWPTGDARLKAVREAILRLPGGNPGWAVTDELTTNCVVLEWRKRPELPGTVPLAGILPAAVTPRDWANIPLGVSPSGATVGVNLKRGPHGMVQGATGTGKTIFLVDWAVQALMRGHDVVVIDPVKEALDYEGIRPFCTAVATTFEEAAAAIQRAYEEGAHRRVHFRPHGAVRWDDLPQEVRDREGIRPLTVIVDEYESLTEPAEANKALDKSHPLVQAALELNASKALVAAYVPKIARELRSAGVHLAIGTQQASADALKNGGGTGLRRNLTSTAMLMAPGSAPDPNNLKFLFQGQHAEQAEQIAAVLDDGQHLGLAVMAAEGGGVEGLRVGYARLDEVAGLLDERGVPRVTTPWDLTGDVAARPRIPREGTIIEADPRRAEPLPDIVEEIEDISLDELGLDFSFDEDPTAVEAVAPEPVPAVSEPIDDDNLIDVDEFIQARPARKPKSKVEKKAPVLDDPWGLVD